MTHARRTPIRRTAAALALGALALTVAAPATDAAPSPNKVRERTSHAFLDGPAGTTARAVAVCPKGMSAISGTWRTTNFGGGALSVTESMRLGPRAWSVEAVVVAPASPEFKHKLVAFAACQRRRAPKAVSNRQVVPVGGGVGHFRQGHADCPKGLTALSGGFSADLPQSGSVTGSYRSSGDSWLVEILTPADDPAGQVPLRTTAYCIKGKGQGVRTVEQRVSVASTDATEGVEGPDCPYLAGSVGFRALTDEQRIEPGERVLIPHLYYASFRHAGGYVRAAGTMSLTFKVFAYCVRR